MLNTDLYDALRAARVEEPLARKAASSVTDQPTEYRRLDDRIVALQREVDDVRSTLKLHGWMLTLSIGLSVAILARLLFIPPFG